MSDLDAGGSSAPPGSKVKNKSLDFLVNKLKDTAGSSREGSPEPPSKEQKGRSSRRKPTVTRKVVEDEERLDDSFQEEDSLLAAAALLGAGEPMDTEEGQGDAVRTNGFDDTAESADEQKPEETIDIDEDGNFIVPEGTVVVEPEAVEDKRPEFKGPEFAGRTGGSSSRANKSKSSDILDNLHCSACNRQINPNSLANVKRHPVLQVLLCKRCYTWYTSAELDQDSDGIDEQCRWCGEGGNLVCCDYCSNVICKGCIKRNLGRAELKAITDSGPDDKWHCYVCDPKPLANLIQECTNIIEAVTKTKEKEKEQQKKHKAQQKTPAGGQDKAKKPKLSGSAQKAKENSGNSSKTSAGPMKTNVPTVANLLMNKRSPQQIVGTQAVPGGIQIVQKQGNKNIVYTLPSGSAVVQQRTPQGQQRGSQQISPGKQGLIPVQKVENTIYRLLAATQSMQLLTTSLKDAFKKTGEIVAPHGTQTQRDVAMQLSRAFTSFKRSLNDIDDYAHGKTGPKAAPAQQQQPQKVVHVSGQLVSQYKGPASGKVRTSPSPAKSVLKPDVGNMASQIIAQAASQLRSKPVATSTPIGKSSGPLRVKLPFKGPKKTSEDVICIEDNSDDSPSPQKKGSPHGQKSKSASSKKTLVNGEKKEVKVEKKEVKGVVNGEKKEAKVDKKEAKADIKPKKEEKGDPEADSKDKKIDPEQDQSKEDFIIEENVDEEGDESKEEVKTEEAPESSESEKPNADTVMKEEASADEQAGAVSETEPGSNTAEANSESEAADAVEDSSSRRRSDRQGIRRTKEDIEAQRQMHRELLEDSSDDDQDPDGEDGAASEGDDSDSDEEDSDENEKSSEEEYEPSKGERVEDITEQNKKKKKKTGWQGRKKLTAKEAGAKFNRVSKKAKEKRKKLRAKLAAQKEKEDNEESEKDKDESGTGDSDSESEEKSVRAKGKSAKPVKGKGKSDSGEESEKSKSKRKNRKKTEKTDENSDDSVDFKVEKRKKKPEKTDENSDDSVDSKTEKRKSPRKMKTTAKRRTKDKKDSSDSENDSSDKNERKSTKRKRQHSDSSHDSDLEKDIKKLAKAPNVGKTKKKKDEDSSDKKKSTDSKKSKNKNKKGKDDEDLSSLSGEESEQESEEEHPKKKLEEVEEEEPMSDAADDEAATEDANERARKELLAGSSDSDEDEVDMLSDDDDDKQAKTKKGKGKKKNDENVDSEAESGKKKKKSKDKKKESEEEDDEDEASGEESGRKKKKKPKHKLLNIKLSSESDSDIEESPKSKKGSKKSSKKKRKLRDSDEGSYQGESDEEDSEEDTKDSEANSVDSNMSDEEEFKSLKKKGKGKGKGTKRRRLKKMKNSSDSDSSDPELKKRKKKRKKKGSGTDEEDEEDPEDPGSAKKRKNIRKVIKDKKLDRSTKEATKAEEERRKRVKERQALYNEQVEEDKVTKVPVTTKLVLETDPHIEVNKTLIRKLKPHQVEAVKFLYDCAIESIDRVNKEGDEGSGCILAHCMGLGKTLSVITFAHTMLSYEEHTNMKTCLVVCPLNTVLNWMNEWVMWQKDMKDDDTFIVYELASVKENWKRADYLEEWNEDGGIMIMGYEMYRNLASLKRIKNKKMKAILTKTLVDPGPDLVICDEGHILKNSATGLSQAMNKVRTLKRIVLTGTPLQNNLIEYHCMVDFVKPKLLGTKKEFCNRFVNPITNGQAADSTERDVRVMKKRAHVLHETLAGCVQRKDYTALAKFLPPKLEYVLSIRLSPTQISLYENYLQRVGQVAGNISAKGGRLFSDYQYLMRIWTHPWVLRLNEIRAENKAANDYDSEDSFLDDNDDSEGEMSLDDNSDDEVEAKVSNSDDSSDNTRGTRRTRATRTSRRNKQNGEDGDEIVKDWKTKSRGGEDGNDPGASTSKSNVPMEEEQEEEDTKISAEWWSEFVSKDDQYKLELSGKLMLLSEILRMCENIGDKVLVFSQSLLSLDLIEDYLELWDSKLRGQLEKMEDAGSDEEEDENKEDPLQNIPGSTFQGWLKGLDYFRMDGSSSAHNRRRWSETFNDPENLRARLFLISTRAGSLGTNLVGANRVIIFDASWNPSYDTQSMFRVYRFGQDKPVYIYRFVAQGTMEEKIYGRQVTKQSLSQRVVDEHQIERHFSAADLQELYSFEPDRLDDPNRVEKTPKLPTDMLLAELLTEKKDWLVTYHEHDSLLENILDEGLTEEERKAAWEEYEEEKKHGFSRAAANANMDAAARFNAMTASMMQTPRMDVLKATQAIYASNPGATPEQVRQQLATWMQWYQQQHMQQQARMYQERMQAEQRLWQMQQQNRDRMQMAAFENRGNENSAQALQRMAQQAQNLPGNAGGASGSLHDLLTKPGK